MFAEELLRNWGKLIFSLVFEEAFAALRDVIGTEALRFQFLLESSQLTEAEKDIYRALVKMEDGAYTMSSELLMTSLQKLSALLAKHYGCKTIILIDEYEVPLDKAFQAGYYEEMVSLIRNLFSNGLKTNDYLKFAVLTGCLRISKESILHLSCFWEIYCLTTMNFLKWIFCQKFFIVWIHRIKTHR